MKKIMSFLLVLCLLAASAALAVDAPVGVDMRAHEGMDFILMEDRHTLTDAATYQDMQWAYETIHASAHFSDMAARDHLNGIRADIDPAIAAMNLTAYDYLIYDSFELQLQEGYEALLANGNTVELRFDLNLDRNVHPVVLLSNDQAAWKCIDPAQTRMNEDGSLSVRFDEMGTVLILVEIQHKVPGSADYDGSFTPSITGKAAPDVIAPDKKDTSIIALIYNELDQLISKVPDEGYLVITPVSRRTVAEDKEVRERLEWAYNQIITTPRIGNLPAGSNLSVAAGIDAVLDASGFADLTSDDMIVRDLFDASLYGTEYVSALREEGHYIEIIFDLKVDPNDPLVILLTNDNKTWKVLDWSAYEINPNGTVTVRLEEMGALAILVDAESSTTDGSDVKSPKTGEE